MLLNNVSPGVWQIRTRGNAATEQTITMRNYSKTIGALAAASTLVAGNAMAELEGEVSVGYTNMYEFRFVDQGNDLVSAGVDLAGNIILRNTCSDNTTNWSIAADNVFGPIVDRTTLSSSAVSGDSAPDSSSNSNPNANFTY